MNYYNQTDKSEVEKIHQELEEDGFNVSVTHSTGELRRENNKYRKSMTWHFTEKNENGRIFYSDWFTSRPSFEAWLNTPRQPLPIGVGMSIRYLEMI